MSETPGARPAAGLEKLVAEQLERAVGADVRSTADHLAARPGVLAVLFYGNRLRCPGAAGLLDFYVLTDADSTWSGAGLGALGNRLLPPNVYRVELSEPAVTAKVAVMRLAAFRARLRAESWDTTLWARFAQPAALLHARDADARRAVVEAIATAWCTAAYWADRLAAGEDRWAALFAQTYGAELRIEGGDRARTVVGAAPDLYAAIDCALPPSRPTPPEVDVARRAWRRRRRLGRALNALRLVKASATFQGGMSYALGKIERHAGPDALTPWARRLPWLAAPAVIARLLLRAGPR